MWVTIDDSYFVLDEFLLQRGERPRRWVLTECSCLYTHFVILVLNVWYD